MTRNCDITSAHQPRYTRTQAYRLCPEHFQFGKINEENENFHLVEKSSNFSKLAILVCAKIAKEMSCCFIEKIVYCELRSFLSLCRCKSVTKETQTVCDNVSGERKARFANQTGICSFICVRCWCCWRRYRRSFSIIVCNLPCFLLIFVCLDFYFKFLCRFSWRFCIDNQDTMNDEIVCVLLNDRRRARPFSMVSWW